MYYWAIYIPISGSGICYCVTWAICGGSVMYYGVIRALSGSMSYTGGVIGYCKNIIIKVMDLMCNMVMCNMVNS